MIPLNDQLSGISPDPELSQVSLNDQLSDILLDPELSQVPLNVEFSGGLELLFSNKKKHRVHLPSSVPSDNSTHEASFVGKDMRPVNLTYLIHYLRHRLLKERAELFFEKGTV
jgi:ubiquitin related modifier 1